ncbi:hypothetical protein M0208_13575 [Sphingomonas sp. SUN019]|nr:hypothetical protein [Sphingomonas sp. SUN019]UVO51483.1 hypothetical protein M0208_13575 [Sphingomonas sp. SUN019]
MRHSAFSVPLMTLALAQAGSSSAESPAARDADAVDDAADAGVAAHV